MRSYTLVFISIGSAGAVTCKEARNLYAGAGCCDTSPATLTVPFDGNLITCQALKTITETGVGCCNMEDDKPAGAVGTGVEGVCTCNRKYAFNQVGLGLYNDESAYFAANPNHGNCGSCDYYNSDDCEAVTFCDWIPLSIFSDPSDLSGTHVQIESEFYGYPDPMGAYGTAGGASDPPKCWDANLATGDGLLDNANSQSTNQVLIFDCAQDNGGYPDPLSVNFPNQDYYWNVVTKELRQGSKYDGTVYPDRSPVRVDSNQQNTVIYQGGRNSAAAIFSNRHAKFDYVDDPNLDVRSFFTYWRNNGNEMKLRVGGTGGGGNDGLDTKVYTRIHNQDGPHELKNFKLKPICKNGRDGNNQCL